MKNLLLILILVVLCVPVAAKKFNNDSDIDEKIAQLESEEIREKVAEHVYLELPSVNDCGQDCVQGTFREYNTEHNKFKNKVYAYAQVAVKAYYEKNTPKGEEKIDFPIYEYCNAKGKSIGEYNIYKKDNWKDLPRSLGNRNAKDVQNGEVYYNTLIKYYKARK